MLVGSVHVTAAMPQSENTDHEPVVGISEQAGMEVAHEMAMLLCAFPDAHVQVNMLMVVHSSAGHVLQEHGAHMHTMLQATHDASGACTASAHRTSAWHPMQTQYTLCMQVDPPELHEAVALIAQGSTDQDQVTLFLPFLSRNLGVGI